MKLILDIQNSVNIETPSNETLKKWVHLALSDQGLEESAIEISIRIINKEEMQQLNETYRGKTGPTNILSFPFVPPPGLPEEATSVRLLGDIVICAPLATEEARQQGKDTIGHWSHLVIHGVLHLLGYDHEHDKEATLMEALEIKLLKVLGFPHPYEGNHHALAH